MSEQRYPVGTRVIAPNPDHYLRDYHGVKAGETVGVIKSYSRLDSDDTGVLVDWGNGEVIRCEMREIARAAQVVPQPDRERLAQRILDTMLRSYSPPNGGALAYELADAVLTALSNSPEIPDSSPELAELFPGTLAALDRLSIRPEVQ